MKQTQGSIFGRKRYITALQSNLLRYNISVQFISASRPSTEYFIRNTGTGSDDRSCHL